MSRDAEFRDQTPEIASYGKYLINDTFDSNVSAHLYDDKKWNKLGRRVGSLSFYPGKPERKEDGSFNDADGPNGGVIHKVYVSSQFRRKGIASAMLDFARERHPDREIRHSNALSDDGRAWAEKKP